MRVEGKHYRTVWLDPNDPLTVHIIDQSQLPFKFLVEDLRTVDDAATAISDMHVRGAGCIGATAGYGMYLATLEAQKTLGFSNFIEKSAEKLCSTRPTAVNLSWAVETQLNGLKEATCQTEMVSIAKKTAEKIANLDAEWCKKIGQHALPLVNDIYRKKEDGTVNILTHCNAGWLAFVDYGSATSPIYTAHDSGIPVHVWVDETRPRSQGARLTAWELGKHGVPHTIISDTTSGHLMQKGLVDLVITGTDRTTHTGDVANKIGTYLIALAAQDNGVPFYVALPSSTFDWKRKSGINEIPIEERDADEVHFVSGTSNRGVETIRVTPVKSGAANYAFDITPARLVTALITERGVCSASKSGIFGLYPEYL
ncbi:MAG: Methylthioribose-1-phosphate isomerase [Candidatus Moanabacter tarae]|uniref:Methylthioribose-1-phosphate isomerase n=1 Tax=Candidatus Moanibacter tarae TaxID=2200854 RepID=A0A2Z4AF70_9BACT|nr:MAG: Methylthioribose-1-phosphate isomerase [Candidatus Moanabacter tarae]|tara:strand:+ start:17271 stop:18377 length:1107 start_codon:yes stop_codon:yes gene_type:complete